MISADPKANVTADAFRNNQLQATELYLQHTANEENSLQESVHKDHVWENRIINEEHVEFQSM